MKKFLLPLLVLVGLQVRSANFDPTNTYVFITGVLKWKDSKSLAPFSNVHRKDEELKNKLVAMGVPAGNVVMLLDEKASLHTMHTELKRLSAKCNSESTFIFYYAGHGLKERGRDFYFANYDIDTKNSKTTGFNLDWLSTQLPEINKSQHFIFMADCCYSGGLLEQAKKLQKKDRNVLVFSSATASNTSTGNWTFTQTVIDCLGGKAVHDADRDGKISDKDLAAEIKEAMKYREHQLSGFFAAADNYVFVSELNETLEAPTREDQAPDKKNVTVSPASRENRSAEIKAATTGRENNAAPTRTGVADSENKEKYAAGEYAYGMYEKSWKPVRILSVTRDNKYLSRFYFYSDHKDLLLSPGELKKIFMPTHKTGDTVMVKWEGKKYEARILNAENDFYYITYTGYDHTWNEWVMYDRISTGKEQKAQIEENGKWYPGEVLTRREGKYFIRYDGYDFSWDEWVGKNRIKFE